MHIGNIVTNLDIKEENYNIINNLDDINNDLPTLIIGWSLTKTLLDDVSILHKRIKENLQWTFSEKERKVDFEIDIELFKKDCYRQLGKDIIYVYIDIIHSSKSKIKKIINKIKSFKEPIFYVGKNKMLYIYDENIVFGIDLNMTNLIGIENKRLLKKISDLPNSILIKNEIFNKCSGIVKKINNKNYKILPYIYRHGECNENSHSSIICSKRQSSKF